MRRGRSLIQRTLVAATATAGLSALSVVVYLGPGAGYFFAFVAVTLLLAFSTFALLGGMRAPGLWLGVLRGIPIAASVSGSDLKRYRRAATAPVKAWSSCALTMTVVAVIAANPLTFFPGGDASKSHGRYVESDHGAIVRTLSRAQYEQLNMRLLRFAGTISTFMLAGIATLVSGAMETAKQRPESRI